MTSFSKRISNHSLLSRLDSSRFNEIKQLLKRRALIVESEDNHNELKFSISQGINRETLRAIRKSKTYKEYLERNNLIPKKFDK